MVRPMACAVSIRHRDETYNIHACVVGCRNRRTKINCAAATTVTYTCVIGYY